MIIAKLLFQIRRISQRHAAEGLSRPRRDLPEPPVRTRKFRCPPALYLGLLALPVLVGFTWAPAPRTLDPAPTQTAAAAHYFHSEGVEKKIPRKVFAHYMPNFLISIDNKDSGQDYYATQYLTVHGENGLHAAYGGYLRDRPLPRAIGDRTDWQLADLETEIGQAKSVGIDGFAVDVIVPRAT